MAIKVPFRHPATGEVRHVKVGWNWIMFLFSPVFGIPLFLKGLTSWGWIMLGFCAALACITNLVPESDYRTAALALTQVAVFLLEIRHGRAGNRDIARHLLATGWEFAEPESVETQYARKAWDLDGLLPSADSTASGDPLTAGGPMIGAQSPREFLDPNAPNLRERWPILVVFVVLIWLSIAGAYRSPAGFNPRADEGGSMTEIQPNDVPQTSSANDVSRTGVDAAGRVRTNQQFLDERRIGTALIMTRPGIADFDADLQALVNCGRFLSNGASFDLEQLGPAEYELLVQINDATFRFHFYAVSNGGVALFDRVTMGTLVSQSRDDVTDTLARLLLVCRNAGATIGRGGSYAPSFNGGE